MQRIAKWKEKDGLKKRWKIQEGKCYVLGVVHQRTLTFRSFRTPAAGSAAAAAFAVVAASAVAAAVAIARETFLTCEYSC